MLGRHIRSIIKESLDDLDWIRSSESDFDPNFEFKDFEYWVDLTKLNKEENKLVFDYIKKVVPDYPKDTTTRGNFRNLGYFKGIVVHCGYEDNDYYPEKNYICFLSDTWEQDPYKEHSVYIDGREVLEYIKSTEEDEDLDESLNWSDNDTTSWSTDKNFSTDPTFITDPNWESSPEKSQWVQGGTGGSSESSEDVNESEEDWGWIEGIQEHPNYNGHPQGVVYLYDHDEINEFCDIIENYNGGELPRGNARLNLHQGLENSRNEMEGNDYDPSNALISASFFVEKKDPGLLSVGYWEYNVDDYGIREWLSYGDTFNKDYHLYTNLSQVRKIFEDYQNPELIKESEFDLNWIKEIDLMPTWGELLKMDHEYGFLESGDIIKLRGELTHGLDSVHPRYFDDVIIRFVRYDYNSPLVNHIGPEEVNEWLDIDDTEDEFYMTSNDKDSMVVTNFEDLTKGKLLKESKEGGSDLDWIKDVPGEEGYGEKYRFFEIYVCFSEYNPNYGCDDGYSAFVKIPKYEVDGKWNGKHGRKLIVTKWAAENEQFDREDYSAIRYVNEMDREDYFKATGDPDLINESEDDFGWFETEDLNHLNWKENAEKYGGPKNLARDVYNNDPMSFLLSLPKMEQVQSEEVKNWTLFRYKPNHNLMIYDTKNKEVFINYYEIWTFLRSNFGLNDQEIQGLTKEWLGEVYNLRGITTRGSSTRILIWVG